ncbi:MAG: hypothetical protein NZ553_08780 [Caldilinea sp.]|nr:hypothetical protein [Caldilinea sp.]MDW8440552.1 hypothetical protein [Caldilineaceae bacterium]
MKCLRNTGSRSPVRNVETRVALQQRGAIYSLWILTRCEKGGGAIHPWQGSNAPPPSYVIGIDSSSETVKLRKEVSLM